MNVIDNNIGNIKHLCENHKVDKLYLFGSMSGDTYSDNSDIDLIVRFQNLDVLQYADNYFDLKFSLEELLKRPIDLLEEQSLKNPYFLENIDSSKKLIYG
ncbi:MAG: nucleotidyltransferase domain-containing protein [Bacteroidota bacterium]